MGQTKLEQRKDDKLKKTLEEQLKASEERFHNLFESVRHGIIISTREGGVVDCNQALLDMLEYKKKDEFLRIDLERDLYVNAADRKKFMNEVEEKGYVKDYPVCFKKKNGTPLSVLMTISPRLDEKNKIIGFQGLIIDITEREKMTRELREATRKFQKIAEMGDDGIMVLNEGFQIEFANTLATIITGYTKDKLIGMNMNRLLNEPEQKFLEQMHSQVKEDENKRMCMEMQINRGDNLPLEAEVCLTITKSEEGELKTYVYTRDITHRKMMEREIREANEFLSKLIESSLDSIVVTDMTGNILLYNRGAEELLGYKANEVIGKMNIRNIYPPGVAKEVMQKMRSSDYGGVGRLRSMPMVHKNRYGEMIDGIISASIIYNDSGEEVATVGIFTDLRPILKMQKTLRETQQRLMQSEKLAAMGRLTSQIAHELNNPIYGIMNTLELLKSEVPENSKRRKVLDMALSESTRVSEMLRNMLSFSKPAEEERKNIDINKLLEDIILFHEKRFSESNIAIEKNFAPGLPSVSASPNQIIQVILNMINNAKDAMSGGGTLTMTTRLEGNSIIIDVADTGAGIPDEIKDRIFDAFFTTKQAIKGVGLGLSVCYGIINDHGGDIKVKSEVGKGTTFSIILPLNIQVQ